MLAIVLGISAAACWGFSAVLVRMALRHVSTTLGTLVSLASGLVFTAVLVAILQIGVALTYEPLARLAGPAAVPAAQAAFGLLVMVPAVIMESRAALRR